MYPKTAPPVIATSQPLAAKEPYGYDIAMTESVFFDTPAQDSVTKENPVNLNQVFYHGNAKTQYCQADFSQGFADEAARLLLHCFRGKIRSSFFEKAAFQAAESTIMEKMSAVTAKAG